MQNSKTQQISRRVADARWKRVGGTTLIELMVAVSVTTILMALVGVVFQNAIKVSGSATATGEIMAATRGITQQLERDFKGLRADMPMAIIFEIGLDGYRHDRIVFFAGGDFQVPYSSGLSGNLARIFYGQVTNDDGQYLWLARRFKIMTSDTTVARAPGAWGSSTEYALYDYTLFENAVVPLWKQYQAANYQNSFFNNDRVVSFVRRPNVDNINAAIAAGTGVGADAIQRLYMAGYIREFKIEYPGNGYPETWTSPIPDVNLFWRWPIAYYWNVDDLDPAANFYQIVDLPDRYTWYGVNDMVTPMISWPKALRFTFTLEDKIQVTDIDEFGKEVEVGKYHRDGLTFSYIVKLNQP